MIGEEDNRRIETDGYLQLAVTALQGCLECRPRRTAIESQRPGGPAVS
jgi:hypothetical protein